MNAAELKNHALIAAAAAKNSGFENTYNALVEIVKELEFTNRTQRQLPINQ